MLLMLHVLHFTIWSGQLPFHAFENGDMRSGIIQQLVIYVWHKHKGLIENKSTYSLKSIAVIKSAMLNAKNHNNWRGGAAAARGMN